MNITSCTSEAKLDAYKSQNLKNANKFLKKSHRLLRRRKKKEKLTMC